MDLLSVNANTTDARDSEECYKSRNTNNQNKLITSFLRDLDPEFPAHADVDAWDRTEVVLGHDGASLGPSSRGQALAPVTLGAGVLARRHLAPTVRVLVAELARLNNLVGIVLAVWTVPVIIGNGVQRGIEALHVGDVLALLAEELLVFVLLASADCTAALFALLHRVIFALLADLLLLLLLLDFFGEFRAQLSDLVQVFGSLVGGWRS